MHAITNTRNDLEGTGKPLTDLQSQVLSFIGRFHVAKGYPPTRGEISKEFGWTHPSAAQKHINLIEKKGYIKVMPKISRGIVVVKYD